MHDSKQFNQVMPIEAIRNNEMGAGNNQLPRILDSTASANQRHLMKLLDVKVDDFCKFSSGLGIEFVNAGDRLIEIVQCLIEPFNLHPAPTSRT